MGILALSWGLGQKMLGMAPLFDHGNSLWYREITQYEIQKSKRQNLSRRPWKTVSIDKEFHASIELSKEKNHQLTWGFSRNR